ncbi:alpha/beta fold hydrolase [Aerophototrophica crusticola]|uniref:Alpha/beta fold hydrolase n=1 Tax=Aerophototrophica crusticola TaxID=1709002 RepID=A0A858R5R3_9PROT|nr:alpha/beta fold hydrolase [Rhodospirillaceae bacterium B3]
MSAQYRNARLPLVLLPGLLCDARLWNHQASHLSDMADISVPDMTGADSMVALAGQVLAHMPDRFALAGLSMGGYLAFEILRQAPGRVSRLCLLDTTARPDTAEQRARREGLIRLAEGGKFASIPGLLLPNLIHPDRLRDESLAGTITAMALDIGVEAFCRQQRAIMDRPDSRPGLPSIQVPTLCIVGREDAITPPDRAEEMAAGIPGARVAVVERCGHLSTLEQPEAVTALMREWLAQP